MHFLLLESKRGTVNYQHDGKISIENKGSADLGNAWLRGVHAALQLKFVTYTTTRKVAVDFETTP